MASLIAGMRRAVLAVIALAQLSSPGAVGLAASQGATPTALLPCQDQIDSSTAPLPQYTTTLGQVVLPTRYALSAEPLPSETDPNARYWAKQGLDIRAGASFELVVPPEWQGRLSFGWGSPAHRTTHLKVLGCHWMPSPSQTSRAREWLGFAGGFWVRHPACVSVLVKARHETRRVHIGIGAPCPGQSPPPQARTVTPTSSADANGLDPSFAGVQHDYPVSSVTAFISTPTRLPASGFAYAWVIVYGSGWGIQVGPMATPSGIQLATYAYGFGVDSYHEFGQLPPGVGYQFSVRRQSDGWGLYVGPDALTVAPLPTTWGYAQAQVEVKGLGGFGAIGLTLDPWSCTWNQGPGLTLAFLTPCSRFIVSG
jgi:hypothetical protein